MFKLIGLLAALAGCLAISSAELKLNCADVEQISLADMEQPDNVCHFMTSLEKRTVLSPRSEPAVIQTCTCNMMNKEADWNSLYSENLKAFTRLILQRGDEIDRLKIKPTNRRLGEMLYLEKDKLRDLLENGVKQIGRPISENFLIPRETLVATCKELMDKFGKYNHMVNQLEDYVDDPNFRSVMFDKSQVVLSHLLMGHQICERADYRPPVSIELIMDQVKQQVNFKHPKQTKN